MWDREYSYNWYSALYLTSVLYSANPSQDNKYFHENFYLCEYMQKVTMSLVLLQKLRANLAGSSRWS